MAEVQEDQEPLDCVIVDEIDEEGSSHPQVKDKVSTIYSSETPDVPLAKRCKKSALDILLGPEENEESFTIQDELEMYLQVKAPSRQVNIFEWWKINEARFPNVAKLARSMLCVPGTSTAAEQVFSAAGITVSKRRSCLKPENVDRILFLNKNLPSLTD